MLKSEALSLVVVVAAVVAATVLMTDRAADDWQFAGYFLIAYLLFSAVAWVWRTRRRR